MVAVGARQFLIAYNIVLRSEDVTVAHAIAKSIRTSNGGLPGVKAMGVALKSRGLVQVSMNVTDFTQTPLSLVFQTVHQEAAQLGIEIEESELVGLIPQAAVSPTMAQMATRLQHPLEDVHPHVDEYQGFDFRVSLPQMPLRLWRLMHQQMSRHSIVEAAYS